MLYCLHTLQLWTDAVVHTYGEIRRSMKSRGRVINVITTQNIDAFLLVTNVDPSKNDYVNLLKKRVSFLLVSIKQTCEL